MEAIRFRIAFYVFCAVVALAPLPFGSVDELTVCLWVMLLGSVVILATPFRPTNAQIKVLVAALLVALSWGLVLHEQMSASPWFARALVDPIWARASSVLDVPLPKYVTMVRDQPFFAAGAQIAAFFSLLGGFLLGSNRPSAKTILSVVAWSGALYASYAIVSFIWDPNLVLWREKVAYRHVLTGTFVNRNTAAIYFAACAMLWLMLFFRRALGPSLRIAANVSLSSLFLKDLPRSGIVSLGMFVLLTSATFMTGSRAGSLLFMLTSAGLCFACLRKKGGGRIAMLGLTLGIIAAGAILLSVLGRGVDARFGSEGLTDAARWSVYRAVLRMILDHPWLGTGLGTFTWVFPLYRPGDISTFGIWDRAHSTPLEIAAEQGIPFATLVLCAFLLVTFTLAVRSGVQRSGKIYPLAALVIALLAAAHSLIDFSLQIPGLAIVVFAVVGMGLAQSANVPDAEDAK